MKFRKKPIVIEAMGPLTADNSEEIAAWCGGGEAPRQEGGRLGELVIPTLEGSHRASLGDWIIKEEGEFYPCKSDIFKATYEPLAEAPA